MTAVLYGAKGTTLTTSSLYTINPATGAAASIGAIGFALSGLADRDVNTLWGVTTAVSSPNPNSLIVIHKATGVGHLIGSLGISPDDNGVFDVAMVNGVLYAVYRELAGPTHLVSINRATGAATSIGTFDPTNSAGITDVPGVTAYMYLAEFINGTDTLCELTTVPVKTAEGVITGYTTGDGSVLSLAAVPGDPTSLYALVVNDDGATPPTVNLVHVNAMNLAAPTAVLVGATAAGMNALAWESGLPALPITWTNKGPAGELLVLVAAGLNPGSFTEAARFGPGERRGRIDPLVIDDAPQTQALSVRVVQEGPSAVTEIYSIDIDLRPQPSSLEGENA